MAFWTAKARSLFQETAKSVFLDITGQTYDNMKTRILRKGFYGLPFSKDIFREHVLKAMGGSYDGFFVCRYCHGYFGLTQIAVDHQTPLSRGGGVELDNLDYPCRACNNRKGSTTPEEYLKLLDFLDTKIPLAKADVLNRLEISVQLAAADRARRRKNRQAQE